MQRRANSWKAVMQPVDRSKEASGLVLFLVTCGGSLNDKIRNTGPEAMALPLRTLAPFCRGLRFDPSTHLVAHNLPVSSRGPSTLVAPKGICIHRHTPSRMHTHMHTHRDTQI